MSSLPLQIGALFRREDHDFAQRFIGVARSCGITVENADSGEELLVGAPWDLVIVDAQLPGQWSGLGLLEALHVGSEVPAAILVGEELDFSGMRRALQLGVREFLPRPFTVDGLFTSLSGTVEQLTAGRDTLVRTLAAVRESTDRGARALAAFLLNQGVSPSQRARIVSAAAEVLYAVSRENEHLDPSMRIGLKAARQEDWVRLEITAQGLDLALLAEVPPALPGFPTLENELSRATKLSETLRVHATPTGSRAVLTFRLDPVRFAEEHAELAELDYLHPETSRAWLPRLLREAKHDPLPPTLTSTFGRLLAPRQEDQVQTLVERS